MKGNGLTMDNSMEDELILRAGKCGGEIFEEHGLTVCSNNNLQIKMTKDQWISFLRSVIAEYYLLKPEYEKKHMELNDLNDDIPF